VGTSNISNSEIISIRSEEPKPSYLPSYAYVMKMVNKIDTDQIHLIQYTRSSPTRCTVTLKLRKAYHYEPRLNTALCASLLI
jgi:hypothetical protein